MGSHLLHVALMNRTNTDFAIIMIQCFFMTKCPFCASRGAGAPLILIEITASVSSNGSEDKFVIEMSEQSLQKKCYCFRFFCQQPRVILGLKQRKEKKREQHLKKVVYFIVDSPSLSIYLVCFQNI